MSLMPLPDDWVIEEPPDLYFPAASMEEPPDWVFDSTLPQEPPDLFPDEDDMLLQRMAQYAPPPIPAAQDYPMPEELDAAEPLDLAAEGYPAQWTPPPASESLPIERDSTWRLQHTGILIEEVFTDQAAPDTTPDHYAVGVVEVWQDPQTGDQTGAYLHLADAPHLVRAEEMRSNIYRLADEAEVADADLGDFAHGLIKQRGEWQPLTDAQWQVADQSLAPDAPNFQDDATWAARDRLLAQVFEVSGNELEREEIDQPHELQTVMRGLGLQAEDFNPANTPPPLFDETTNTAYWIGVQERHRVTPHSELPELPTHSDVNWRERGERWSQPKEAQPIPHDYRSPQAVKPLPERPRQVLIAGSMNANNAQLNYASALVVRAAEIGAQIHVGDNDQGVDARVVETANAIDYDNVVVWTAGDAPRNGGVEGGQIRKVPYNFKEKGNRYTQRDRTMIRGLDEEQGAAFFVGNGHTHHKNGRLTGTEAGFAFAVEQGKAARKVSFGRKQDREAELKPLPTTYTPQYQPVLPAELDLNLSDPPELFANSQPLPLEDDEPIPQTARLLTDEDKWGSALETAEMLAQERSQRSTYTGRPGYRGAEVLEVQTLPVANLEGESLGYAVAAVDVRWGAIPFKINTDDWRGADTVSVTEIAHFKQAAQAEDYAEHLRDFMVVHELGDNIATGRDFLREVGQLNGLRSGTHTTDLIRMGTAMLPNYRAEVGALQAGEWELKTLELGFRPMERHLSVLPPEPLYGFSIQAMQTVDAEEQHLGYSTVALRDVYQNGLPIESDISQSYIMELARFEQQADAQHYAEGLTQYIKDKPDLEFIGSPENLAGTQAFLARVAQENVLQPLELLYDHTQPTQQAVFQPQHHQAIMPMLASAESPNFSELSH